MPMPALYVTFGSGRIVHGRSNRDLQAAGWISWSPGGGWRLTRAGQAYIRHLLTLYTREDAARHLARGAAGRRPVERAVRDPKWERMRRMREPVFGERARGGR